MGERGRVKSEKFNYNHQVHKNTKKYTQNSIAKTETTAEREKNISSFATLQTKTFRNDFIVSKLILDVNNFLFFMTAFLACAIQLFISILLLQSKAILMPKYQNSSTSIKVSFPNHLRLYNLISLNCETFPNFSLTFLIVSSTYRLNSIGDRLQFCHTPFLIDAVFSHPSIPITSVRLL